MDLRISGGCGKLAKHRHFAGNVILSWLGQTIENQRSYHSLFGILSMITLKLKDRIRGCARGDKFTTDYTD
jgi:hypothetical protein